MDKIIEGVSHFQSKVYPKHQELFHRLTEGQAPETLLITCADSRIDPNLITQSNPGELFICRNAGNIVPPHSLHTGGTTASIEYAVGALGVGHVIVCGHTDCGAMKGALNQDGLAEFPHVCEWLKHSDAAVRTVKDNYSELPEHEKLERLIEQNVLVQLQHLRTHPYVASRMNAGKIVLHGWVYHIGSGEVTAYNEHTGCFEPLSSGERKPKLTSGVRAVS